MVSGRLLRVVLGCLAVLGTCQTADAAAWRLSGPQRPPAGESVSYVLHGAPGRQYEVVVFAGARHCPRDRLAADLAPTLKSSGFLDGNGADVRQLSFASGHSTICAYDGDTATIVTATVVRTTPGRDRLRITIPAQQDDPAYDAVVTATGYVGREADPVFADEAAQHVATVVVTARSRRARCPKASPDQHAPDTGFASAATARFSTAVTITNAFEAADPRRLCGYLVARRRVPGGVRARTVARAQLLVPGADTDRSDSAGDSDTIAGGLLAWIFVGLLIAAATVLFRRDRSSHPATGPAAADQPPFPATTHSDSSAGTSSGHDFVQRRRDEDVSFAIQRAAGATADVYRDRLRLILEHQDGRDWLEALNRRRLAAMLAKGHGPPRAYRSFEPRAVLNCLAYDPAGLQLIDLDAVDAARKLCALANAAHHPDPDTPLTQADYQRAWQLYTKITGYAAPFDRATG